MPDKGHFLALNTWEKMFAESVIFKSPKFWIKTQ